MNGLDHRAWSVFGILGEKSLGLGISSTRVADLAWSLLNNMDHNSVLHGQIAPVGFEGSA